MYSSSADHRRSSQPPRMRPCVLPGWMSVALVMLVLFPAAAPARAELGDVLHTIPCAGDNTADLAWVDGELYQVIFSPTEQRNIYRLDPLTGDVLGIVPYAGTMPQGLAYDGEHLWQVCLSLKRLYKMDSLTGEVLDSFDAPGEGNGQPLGLGWDGEWLWLADSRDPEKIWQLDTDGNVLGQFPTPGDSPYGLAWADGFIWVSDNSMGGTAPIYKIDAETGEILDSFPCPGGGGSPNGITHDGEYLWIAVNTNDVIYQVDDGVAGATVESPGTPLAAGLRLLSARAEPDRGAIEIRYSVPDPGEIQAQIFDITGRQAMISRTHASGSGFHTFHLTPEMLASGRYLLRLSRPGESASLPVLILR